MIEPPDTDTADSVGKLVCYEASIGFLKARGAHFPSRLSELNARGVHCTTDDDEKAVFKTFMREKGVTNMDSAEATPHKDVGLLDAIMSGPIGVKGGNQGKESLANSGVSKSVKRSDPMKENDTELEAVPEKKVKAERKPKPRRITAGELNWPYMYEPGWNPSTEKIQDTLLEKEKKQKMEQATAHEVLDAQYKKTTADTLMIQRNMNSHHHPDTQKVQPSKKIMEGGRTVREPLFFPELPPNRPSRLAGRLVFPSKGRSEGPALADSIKSSFLPFYDGLQGTGGRPMYPYYAGDIADQLKDQYEKLSKKGRQFARRKLKKTYAFPSHCKYCGDKIGTSRNYIAHVLDRKHVKKAQVKEGVAFSETADNSPIEKIFDEAENY